MEPEEKKQQSSLTSSGIQTAKQWIKQNRKEIQPGDWVRAKYYSQINIPMQSLHQQSTTQKQQISLNIFTPKSNDEIRNRYLGKLKQYGIMKENNSKKHQHLYIFDWDDTILCTSYLSAFQFLEINNDAKALLKKLDDCAEKLLTKTIQKIQKGDAAYIITNAAKGWVQYSSKIYLPKTHTILEEDKIKIISARSLYGEEFPGDFGRWKVQAFKSILKTVDKYLLTNMVCMGDSNIEIEAAHCLGKQFDKCVLKTIKFRENPRPDELIKQLDLVIDKFKQIFTNSKNLTIRLQRKTK